MNIIRTIVWVLIAVVATGFIALNWTPVPVNLWPLDTGYLHVQWPVGVVALVSFVLGMTPMWLMAKAKSWRLKRRIATLENTVKATTPTPPLATSTQLDAMAATENRVS